MPTATRNIDTEASLWRAYWHGRCDDAFNRLVNFYLPWVKQIAFNQAAKLPDSVDWQDLFQDGSIALLDCIRRFDKRSGLKFKTFAMRRIAGSFSDGLRNMDWVPRLVRQRKEPVVVMRQEKILYNENADEKQDASHPKVYDRKTMELRDEVRRALRGLRKNQRLSVILCFLEGLSMKEAAESIGVSESRVSQIISETIVFIRSRERISVQDHGNIGNHRKSAIAIP